MIIDSHCHVFSFDCIPEELRDRFPIPLDFDNPLDWIFYSVLKNLFAEGTGPREILELAEMNIAEITMKLAKEMKEADVDLCIPMMMDMEYCERLQSGNIKDFHKQLTETELAAGFINSGILDDERHQPRIHPFIAFDPRRPGILDIVKEKIPADPSKRTVFWGVKIYPPMGYYPHGNNDTQRQILYKLYDYCEENRIPITTHAMKVGGIPGLTEEDNERANPIHWIEVLDHFKHLVLDLGHNGTITSEWRKTTLELVESFPNVYTDVAYNIEMWFMPRQYFQNVKNMLHIEDPGTDKRHIPHRLMYGTDWFLHRFLGSQKTYKKWFTDYHKEIPWVGGLLTRLLPLVGVWLSNEELKRLMEDNPKQFLGMAESATLKQAA
ncbi:MAG: amidohydrolase family protein [Candidatus Competibacteraceae bacterium]